MKDFDDILNGFLIVAFILLYGRLVISYHLIKRFRRINTFIVVIATTLFIFFSWLINQELFNNYTVNYDFRLFISYCFPLFLLMASINSSKSVLERFYKYSWILFLVATISFLLFLTASKTLKDYSMSYGYAVMPFTVIQLFKYNIDKKIKKMIDLIEVILSSLYIIVAGSRGPIVCIIVCFIIVFLFHERMTIKRAIFIGTLLVFGVVIILNLSTVVTNVINVLEIMNISPRTLYLIQMGRGTYDSGRDEIHETIIQNLNESPILGLGAFGAEAKVSQAHGLFIDLLANFGYLFGTIIILLLLYNISKGIFKYRGTDGSELLLILSIMCIPKGLFAGGFWIDKELWMIVGLLFSHSLQNEFLSQKKLQ